MDAHDVLVLPVMSRPAPKHRTVLKDNEIVDGVTYPAIANLTDSLPSGTVRVGTSPDGLSIGVLAIGRPFREDIVLRVLTELESEFGGWQPVPNLCKLKGGTVSGC